MELSVNAKYFMKTRPHEDTRTPYECMKLFYDAGFRIPDYTPNTAGEDWEAQTDAVIDAAARCGMEPEQSHAPYKAIGYTGNLTYEFVYGCRPACLMEDFAATAYKTGMYLKSIFDNA